jgi:hypothetical protein
MRDALQALYSEAPMSSDAQAETWHALQLVPTSKRQGDLSLTLPEPDSR